MQAVPVRDEHGRAAGLSPGPLLVQQELAARVVDGRPAQVHDDLQRKHEVAVQVAVQRVPTTRAVFQQERCGPGLTGGWYLKVRLN